MEDRDGTYKLEDGTCQPEGGTYHLRGGISKIKGVSTGWRAAPVTREAVPII